MMTARRGPSGPRPLRILVLNLRDIRNPQAGGAERHLHELFSRLAARGHEVTLHCGSYRGGARRDLVDGLRIVRRGGRFTTTVWSILYYMRRPHAFDVIVDYTCQLHFLTPLYVRQPRVAVAMHIVGDVYCHDLPLGTGRLLAWWEAVSLRLFYGKERFLAISESTALELRHHGIDPDRIRIIYCGRAEPPPPTGLALSPAPSIIYHGRLRRYKRVDWLLDALPAIRQQVPGTRLDIVGSGSHLIGLQRKRDRLGLDGAVTFHGFLPDAERWRLLGAAWLNVQPSIKEGWGLTVIEAAQCGVPSVVSRVPGLQDAVREGETGELFDAEDPADLVRQVVALLKDVGRRERLGRQAVRWAGTFEWDRASVELEHLLVECVTDGVAVAVPDPAHARS